MKTIFEKNIKVQMARECHEFGVIFLLRLRDNESSSVEWLYKGHSSLLWNLSGTHMSRHMSRKQSQDHMRRCLGKHTAWDMSLGDGRGTLFAIASYLRKQRASLIPGRVHDTCLRDSTGLPDVTHLSLHVSSF